MKTSLFLLLLLIVAVSGCDSNVQTDSSSETQVLFVGTWLVETITDDRGNLTDRIEDTFNKIQMEHRVGTTNTIFTWLFDAIEAQSTQRLSGTYSIDAGSFTVTYDTSVPCVTPEQEQAGLCGKIPLLFAYELEGDQAPGGEGAPPNGPHILRLTTQGQTVEILNVLLQSELEGVVQLVFEIEKRETSGD